MASQLGTAYLTVVARTDKIAPQITKSMGGAGAVAGKQSGSMFTKAFKVMAAGAAALGVGKLIGKTISMGMTRAMSIENAEKKLKGLGHSAADVEKIMASAMASVKGTAYGYGDAASVAAMMAASSVATGTAMTHTLKTITSVAAVSGRSLTDIGNIFSSVAAKGKMQGDDMLQLMSSGIPVLKSLSDHLGITQTEAQKLVSDGKISFNDFRDAMSKSMGPAAWAMADTFSGRLMNVNAALGRFGQRLMEPAMKLLSTGFSKAIPFIDLMTEKVEPLSKSLANKLQPALRNVEEGFKALVIGKTILKSNEDGLVGVTRQATPLQNAMFKLRDIFGNVGTILKNVFASLRDVGKSFGKMALSVLPPLVEIFGRLADLLAKNPKLVELAVKAFIGFKVTKGVIGGLTSGLDKATSALTGMKKAINTGFGLADLGKNFGSFIGELKKVPKIAGKGKGALDGLLKFPKVHPVVTGIAAVGAGLGLFFTKTKTGQKIWEKFTGYLGRAWDGLKSKASQVFSGIKQTITSALGGAFTTARTILGKVTSALGAFFTHVWSVVVKVWDAIKAVFGAIVGFFKGLVDGIKASGVFSFLKSGAGDTGSVFKTLGDVVKKVASGIVPVLKVIFGIIKVAIGAIVTVFKVVFTVIKKVAEFLAPFFTIAGKVIGFLVGTVIKAAIAGIGTVFKVVWNIVKIVAGILVPVFKTIWGLITSIWSVIKAVFTTIVGFFVGIWEKTEGVRSLIAGFFETVWGIIQTAWGILSPIFEGIWNVLSGIWGVIKSIWDAVVGFFKGIGDFFGGVKDGIESSGIGGILEGVWGFISGIWEGVRGFFGAIGDFFGGVLETAGNIWNGITDTIGGAWDWLSSKAGDIWGGIKGVVGGAWDWLSEKAGGLWGGITDTIGGAWEGLKSSASSIWGNISDTVGGAWDWLSEKAGGLWNGIKGIFSKGGKEATDEAAKTIESVATVATEASTTVTSAGEKSKSLMGKAWDGIKSTASNAWDGVKSTISGAWDGITSTVSASADGVKSTVETAWNGVTSTASTIWDGVKTTVNTAWDGVKETAGTTWDGITSTLGSAWDGLKTKAGETWDGVKETAGTTWDGMKTTASTAWGGITSTLGGLWGGIKSKAGDTWDGIKSTASNAWDGVKSTASTAWGGIKSTIGGAWDGIKSSVASSINSTVDATKSSPAKITSALSGLSSLNSKANTWFGDFDKAAKAKLLQTLTYTKTIPALLKAAFGNLGSMLTASGRSLMQGFLNGITAMTGRILATVKNTMSQVRSYFPFSPAKKGPFSGKGWVLYSGQAVGEAYAEGIERRTRLAVHNAQVMMRDVSDVFNPRGMNGNTMSANLQHQVAASLSVESNQPIIQPLSEIVSMLHSGIPVWDEALQAKLTRLEDQQRMNKLVEAAHVH
ncbi:MAG: tape measure protein [Propionibacteriaceae bacterium]|nr:tape measure protein [Propionibacteriaceae bacterium]